MTESATTTSPSSPNTSRRRGGGTKRCFSKAVFFFIFVAGLLTILTWSHFLQDFYSNYELFKTASKATVESLEVMSLIMDATDAAAAAVVTTTQDDNTKTSINSSASSSVVTVQRIASSSSFVAAADVSPSSSSNSKGLDRLTDIYEAIANATRHYGIPWPNPKKNPETCQHYTVLTRHEYAKSHNITTTTTSSSNLTSSVEFIGCCGLGHRLSRMAGAAHIAHTLETTFLSHWGCCGTTDVFYDLFGFDPILFGQPITPRPSLPSLPVVNNSSENKPQHKHHLQFRFETPPFETLKKHGVKCPCSKDKIDSDFNFYNTLRNRYTRKHEVDAFVQQYFYNHTSIGLHIRAGNGEKGDFTRKGREINNNDEFVQATIQGIHEILRNVTTTTSGDGVIPPPILFIATDTPHFIQDFRVALNGTMSVVELSQPRAEDGHGVLFGEFSRVTSKGDACMGGWHSAVQDQLILSSAVIVMAAKTSSFTQSLPLSIVTGRVQYPNSPHNQPARHVYLQKPFCEGVPPMMTCFESVSDWCCNTRDRKPTYHDVLPAWREWV